MANRDGAKADVLQGTLDLLVPGQIGVMGFYDVGRVFVVRHSLLSLQIARSEGDTGFYLRSGLVF